MTVDHVGGDFLEVVKQRFDFADEGGEVVDLQFQLGVDFLAGELGEGHLELVDEVGMGLGRQGVDAGLEVVIGCPEEDAELI